MLKIYLCFLIVIASTYLGIAKSNTLILRKNTLQDFVLILKNLICRLSYTSDCLTDVFNDVFTDFDFNEQAPFLSQWEQLLISYSHKLKKSDISLLLQFGTTLGCSDLSTQIKHINMYIELLNKQIDDAQHQIDTKSRLYRVFGFSLGTVISILLI